MPVDKETPLTADGERVRFCLFWIMSVIYVKIPTVKLILMRAEFFKTIYLNQYSGSSLTWKKAFEWLN